MRKKQKINQIRQNSKHSQTKYETGAGLIFFISLGAVIGASWVHDQTIIDFRIPVVTVVLGSIIALLMIALSKWNFLNAFCTLLFAITVGGGCGYAGLFFLNKIPNGAESQLERLPILRTGEAGWSKYDGCFNPYIIVSYYGTNKKLVFPCAYKDSISAFTTVELRYTEGLLGFPIISAKRLIR